MSKFISILVLVCVAASAGADIVPDLADYLKQECAIDDPAADRKYSELEVDSDYDHATYAAFYDGIEIGAFNFFGGGDRYDDLPPQIDRIDLYCPAKTNLYCENGLEQAADALKTEITGTDSYIDYVYELRQDVENTVIVDGELYLVTVKDGTPVLTSAFALYWKDVYQIAMGLDQSEVTYVFESDYRKYTLLVDYNSVSGQCNFDDSVLAEITYK